MENLLDIYKQLEQLGYRLAPYKEEDEEALYPLFRAVVQTGQQFPYECDSKKEFHRQFLSPLCTTFVCHSLAGEVVGGFYIKPNFPGRARHVSNAAYMVKETCRGQGIGTLLVKASLHLAKDLGFMAMQFNMVFSQNPAIKLYQRLGFHIVGSIPNAIRNPDSSYQDGYVMYRELKDL